MVIEELIDVHQSKEEDFKAELQTRMTTYPIALNQTKVPALSIKFSKDIMIQRLCIQLTIFNILQKEFQSTLETLVIQSKTSALRLHFMVKQNTTPNS